MPGSALRCNVLARRNDERVRRGVDADAGKGCRRKVRILRPAAQQHSRRAQKVPGHTTARCRHVGDRIRRIDVAEIERVREGLDDAMAGCEVRPATVGS